MCWHFADGWCCCWQGDIINGYWLGFKSPLQYLTLSWCTTRNKVMQWLTILVLLDRTRFWLEPPFSYQWLCWTWLHPALKRTFYYLHIWEVQLPLGLTPLGDPIQSIPRLWNQHFWVGTHHGFVFGKKNRCPLLWLRSNRTRTNALGSTRYYCSNHS